MVAKISSNKSQNITFQLPFLETLQEMEKLGW